MKKLFFFRSSASNGTNNVGVLPPLTDKASYSENLCDNRLADQVGEKCENGFRSPRGLFSKSRNQTSDCQSSSNISGSGLRRSRSLSSANYLAEALEQRSSLLSSDHNKSPVSHKHSEHSSCCRALIPEKLSKHNQFEEAALRNGRRSKRPDSIVSSRSHNDSSGNSPNCSSKVATKVVDRYIDGEQHQERSRPQKILPKIHTGKEAGSRPPRVQYTAPPSPTDSVQSKPSSRSFREAKGTRLHFPSGDWVDSGFGHESPRKLARNVIERLTQTTIFPKTSFEEFDHSPPITIDDVYGGSPKECSNLNVCTDLELERRLEGAKERAAFLAQELEQDHFLLDISFDLPMLIQTIRNLSDDRMNLAMEVTELLQSRIADRASGNEEVRLAKVELELQTRRLEKEKKELQLTLEKELDRRSSDWSSKLEKYQLEERRLRERVRELAEENVSLQREVHLISEREAESRSSLTYLEQKVEELTAKVEEFTEKNQELWQENSELREKYVAAEGNGELARRNFQDKDKECRELHKSIVRLVRACNDQGKTIEGLRDGCGEGTGRQQLTDKQLGKLRMEQMRLTGVELALRKELESSKQEIDSLRRENLSLLGRLKCNERDSVHSFRLESEISTRLCSLQDEALSILDESTNLGSKLLELIKSKFGCHQGVKQDIETIKNTLDEQFIVDADVKVHGFRRKIESLTRSLKTMSNVLHEKAKPLYLDSLTHGTGADDGSVMLKDQTYEDTLTAELKAESLMTSLLRDKLYCREMEVEQLQAELATAVRGADIIRYEVQNALDNLSCATHRIKDLEVQMLKKDEKISELENDLQDSRKEITAMRGLLPKVSQERDLMWKEVQQYSEKNMLLNSEVNMLKKKIDALDEDILLKEGQITILNDSLRNKTFDLLASPDFTREFLLE